jgi:hypothetical protein
MNLLQFRQVLRSFIGYVNAEFFAERGAERQKGISTILDLYYAESAISEVTLWREERLYEIKYI